MNNIQILADIFSSIATLLLAGIAIFQDVIRKWINRPILELNDIELINISIQNKEPSQKIEGYNLRIRIKNIGNISAKYVSIFAKSLEIKNVDGTFNKLNDFPLMNFEWAGLNMPILEYISPQMERHCNIGHIVDINKRGYLGSQVSTEDNPLLDNLYGRTLFHFDLEKKYFTNSHLIIPGFYKLTVLISASNTKSYEKRIFIDVKGKWFKNIDDMKKHGILYSLDN